MAFLVLSVFLGLTFKLYILIIAARQGHTSFAFLSMIAIFALHNGLEFIGYMRFISGSTEHILFRPYYVATTYLWLGILLHCLDVSSLRNRLTSILLFLVPTIFAIFILGGDSIVVGYKQAGYTLTAIRGPYYWTFATYCFASLAASIGILAWGYRHAPTQIASIKTAYSLFALAPVLAVFFIALLFTLSGIGFNLAIIFSLATAVSLFLFLKGESKHKLTDVRRFLPFSIENKTSNTFMRLLDEYVNNEKTPKAYAQLKDGIEREIISYSLKKSEGNISQATEMMGLENRSTLYSMMDRLGMREKKTSKAKSLVKEVEH